MFNANSSLQKYIIVYVFAFIFFVDISFICPRINASGDENNILNNQRLVEQSFDTLDVFRFPHCSKGVYVLSEDLDLRGRICLIPTGVIIKSGKGRIKNGILVGQNTRVLYNEAVFDNVTIGGSWIIPVIKSSLFNDLSYENSLRDVIALTNPTVHNKVIIHKGLYHVKSEINEDACLKLNSNTQLILDGTIKIEPNAFTDYDIIRIEGENIDVKGNGTIIGDKFAHLSKDGEWGMGIRVQKSRNISIKGLKVKNCWGDCIYVGRGSENVIIENCVLDHGRRQGISVTKASRVVIRNCKISNVGGTLPEYAIDVEPNPGESAVNIVINSVEVNNCKGGFLVYGRGQNAYVGAVTIRNCIISGIEKNAVCILACDRAVLNNCRIYKQQTPQVIRCEEVNSLELRNNTFCYNNSLLNPIKKAARNIVGNSPEEPILIMHCDKISVKNNKEVK